jgi:hypothetical protein
MTTPENINATTVETLLPEYRLTWAFVPMSQNPTRVSFIRAANPVLAKLAVTRHIERTEGRILGFYTCEPA